MTLAQVPSPQSLKRRVRPAALALALLVGGVVGGFSLHSNAQNTAPAPAATRSPSVVALIDMVKVFDESEELKAQNTRIREEKTARDKVLDELVEKIKAKQKELNELPQSAPPKDRVNLELEIKRLANSGEDLKKASDAIASFEAGAAMKSLYEKASAVVEGVMAEQGIDIVLLDDRGIKLPDNSASSEVNALIARKQIIAASGRIDITPDVITRVNNNYRANPAAAAPAAPAAAPKAANAGKGKK